MNTPDVAFQVLPAVAVAAADILHDLAVIMQAFDRAYDLAEAPLEWTVDEAEE